MEAQLTPRARELVHLAADLFSVRGYEATSLQDIATAAGIRKASVYAHFERKEDLLRIIFDDYVERSLGAATSVAASRSSSEEKLRLIIRDLFSSIEAYRSHVSIFLQEIRFLDTEPFEAIRAKRDQYERIVVAIIDDGVQNGEIRPLPLEIVTYFVIGMIQWAYRWYEPGGEMSVDELTDLATDVLMKGIGISGAPNPDRTVAEREQPDTQRCERSERS